ncbi:MAG TPA: hypothetical protein VN848_03315 [Gemmatimonadales bacterium]|nr:hypothetical protein [Gemmatimonadales bacterium]
MILATAGCYNFDPVPQTGPQSGSVVITTLTDQGSLDLGRYLGPQVAAVVGRVQRLNGDDIVLSVSSVRNHDGIEHFWKGETVTLPRPDIASVDIRKLSIGRSIFCVVLGIGGAYELTQAFGIGNSGQVNTGPVTPTR